MFGVLNNITTSNIDIIIELPTIYATQSSDIFAHAALKILNYFKIGKRFRCQTLLAIYSLLF